jgi:Protein of unknown function (DUF3225)
VIRQGVGVVSAATVDHPDVLAEVTAAFRRYEAALIAGDLDLLAELFWDSPKIVRFGIADAQWGAEELRAWRAAQPPLPPGRSLARTKITTFGQDTAVVTTLFRYPDRDTLGRQSQTWIRLADGWRIVSAHVSQI